MQRDDGTFAALIYALALLSITFVVGVYALAVLYADYQVHNEAEYEQAERQYCDAFLATIRKKQVASEEGTSEQQKCRIQAYADCQQLRSINATERANRIAAGNNVVSIISLAFVVLATFAAGSAAWFTRRQASIAETAYRNLDRPYVIEQIGTLHAIGGRDDPIKPPHVEVHFSNFGREPAVLVQIAAHLVIAQGPPGDQVLNPSHPATGNDILVSGKDGYTVIATLKGDAWKSDWKEMIECRASLWVAGEFFYRDTQGNNYSVPFEWCYEPIHRKFFKRARPANKSKDHDLWKHHLPPVFEGGNVT